MESTGQDPEKIVTIQLTPAAALPGAKLLPDLIKSGFDKQVLIYISDFHQTKCGCDLTRRTRGKAHPQTDY